MAVLYEAGSRFVYYRIKGRI